MAESVQWALLMPLVASCLIGAIGLCLWLCGRSAAQEAAFAGAESGAIWGGDTAQAIAAANQVAQSSGLADVHVTTDLRGGTLTVEVTARVETFLPDGLDPRVRGRAERPQEQT